MKHPETMKSPSKQQPELLWSRVIMRKWLNISAIESDYSADSYSDDGDDDSASDTQDALPRLRRQKSEIFRTQYTDTKELRICVGTWNVGGKLPPDDLDIDDWIDTDEPADIYVFGLQEIVPLNAGNIFGAEDNSPVPKWENIIRDALNRVPATKTKVKCVSNPPSPSKFKPSDDVPRIEEEILLESDSDGGEEIHPLDEVEDSPNTGDMDLNSGVTANNSGKLGVPVEQNLQRQFSSPKKLGNPNCLQTEDSAGDVEVPAGQNNVNSTKMLSGTERFNLSWPELPLDLLSQHVLPRPGSSTAVKSFKARKSLGAYSSFKSITNEMQSGLSLLAEHDLDALMKIKRRSSYVRVVSKQMVGIFLTIWVRRRLRKYIQNLKVSTVGVGVMGYIGNKGSISVSMSIYQTLFCFMCTHLTSGEKDGDELKRNADVHEIHRRTLFHTNCGIGLPKAIHDHERIILLGDLNYRINLSYEETCELISRKEWSKLVERDQLVQELKKGRAFDGWTEGTLNFPPTYKYETNSDKYCGEDPKAGRRVPAWCDRILSYGKGMRLLNYRRAELKLSDHRPVTATYMVEVEVFCARKLQRALRYTGA